jgi:hypothetical protein
MKVFFANHDTWPLRRGSGKRGVPQPLPGCGRAQGLQNIEALAGAWFAFAGTHGSAAQGVFLHGACAAGARCLGPLQLRDFEPSQQARWNGCLRRFQHPLTQRLPRLWIAIGRFIVVTVFAILRLVWLRTWWWAGRWLSLVFLAFW